MLEATKCPAFLVCLWIYLTCLLVLPRCDVTRPPLLPYAHFKIVLYPFPRFKMLQIAEYISCPNLDAVYICIAAMVLGSQELRPQE